MTRPRRLILMPLTAVALGVLVGLVALVLALHTFGQLPTDRADAGEIGVVVACLVLSVGLGVAVWLIALARASTRLFARERRLGVVASSAGAVFALMVVWVVLAGRLDQGTGVPPIAADALLWVGILLVLATPSLVFLAWDRAGRPAADSRTGPPPVDPV